MPLHPTLPEPDDAASQHSHKVQEAIKAKIDHANGWISFANYMEQALYAPGLGYYSSGTSKFGNQGDFVTAPEISSLFGRTLSRQAIQILKQVNQGSILEFGAGSGRLALDLLVALEKAKCLPRKYYILEVSADLRQRQQALFEELIPHLAPQVEWIEQLPTQFNGLVLANEVLDAMPVHLVTWSNDQHYERGVTWKNNQFEWLEHPLTNTELINIANQLAPQINQGDDIISAYTSEISLATRRFIHSMADILQQGLMLFIDYGFGQSEYYHPQRSQGTLMCHYRHYAHGDPFYLPGIQDITSHVNFSAIYEAAEKTRLALMGYTNQAHFLINCGITELLTEGDASKQLALNNQLQTLVSPAEMGELFKVIAFGKNIAQPLIGFTSGDKSRLL